MTPDPITNRVRDGDGRAIARAISLVEDDGDEGRALVRALYPHSGRAYVIGVTGAPGTGKSTLVDRLIARARQEGISVGVLAVDPTSPFTGGAVLGDRVRMGAHASDPGVFIRSMATRGHLGGLARATSDAAVVLDAAGMGIVIIETVGVGQDEVDIVSMADVSIVVLVPGTGDDMQAIKAGVMEIGDLFVVNKADREGADQVVHAVTASLALKTYSGADWVPPVLKTEATSGTGVDVLWTEIGRFRQWSATTRKTRLHARQLHRLRDLLAAAVLRRVDAVVSADEFAQLADAIAQRAIDPYTAADELVARAFSNADDTKRPGRSQRS